jgi:hypothetical protein
MLGPEQKEEQGQRLRRSEVLLLFHSQGNGMLLLVADEHETGRTVALTLQAHPPTLLPLSNHRSC